MPPLTRIADWTPTLGLLVFTALIGPFGHFFVRSPPGTIAAAPYTSPSRPDLKWEGIPEYDVLEVFGGQRVAGFVVVADQTDSSPRVPPFVPIVPLNQLKADQARIRQYDT